MTTSSEIIGFGIWPSAAVEKARVTLFALIVGHVGGRHASLPVVLYVDPGAGSYALQLILAAASGGLFLVLQQLSRVRSAIKRLFGRDRSKH